MKRTIALIALALMAFASPAAGHHLDRHPHNGGKPKPEAPAPRGCEETVNFILGTLGNDSIVGTRCDDRILGLTGRDFIIGGRGEDIINGNRGRDRIWGILDGEPDILNGGRGRDRCRGEAIDTFISCERVFVVAVP